MSRGTVPVRGYALTRWSRTFVDVVEGRADIAGVGEITESADSRRIAKARRYFRDRHVHRPAITPGLVTASVEGSQLEPFEVTLTMRTVDAATVAELLRANGGVDDVMSVTRGQQPAMLGGLLGPTESADVVSDCTCPDESSRCIHVLAVAYEVAADIDRSPLTLLTVMGTDLSSILDALDDRAAAAPRGDASGDDGRTPPAGNDFYGDHSPLPALPRPARMNPLTDLDTAALRTALRASGVAPGDIAEAIDQLGDLYDRLDPRDAPEGTGA